MERSTQVNGGFGLTAPPEPEALFSETLCYNEPSYGNTPRYAGDIATMRWKADAEHWGGQTPCEPVTFKPQLLRF